MKLTPAVVAAERERILDRTHVVVSLVNDVRTNLGEHFEVEVDPVTARDYREEVGVLFSDGDRAVNVAALSLILRDLDVEGDHPGFVVDELLGRELAASIAGGQPFRLLAEATFHYADIHHHPEGGTAGSDDLDAALAAGFQTRLPGWPWRERESPFGVE